MTKSGKILQCRPDSLFKIQRNRGNINIVDCHIQKQDAVCNISKIFNFFFTEFSDTDQTIHSFELLGISEIGFICPDHVNTVITAVILDTLTNPEIIAVIDFLLGGKPLDDTESVRRFDRTSFLYSLVPWQFPEPSDGFRV